MRVDKNARLDWFQKHFHHRFGHHRRLKLKPAILIPKETRRDEQKSSGERSVEKFAGSKQTGINIEAYTGNIKRSDSGWIFQKFDIVLNGLDNLEARRHVNRLCLSANVPLVGPGRLGTKAK